MKTHGILAFRHTWMWFAHNPLQLWAMATEELLPPGSYSGTTITTLASTVSGTTQKTSGEWEKPGQITLHLHQQALWVKVGLSHRDRRGEAAVRFWKCRERLSQTTSLPHPSSSLPRHLGHFCFHWTRTQAGGGYFITQSQFIRNFIWEAF